MKSIEIIHVDLAFQSHGRYMATVTTKQGTFSHAITRMPLVDAYKSDDKAESDEARRDIAEFVLDSNGVAYDHLTFA